MSIVYQHSVVTSNADYTITYLNSGVATFQKDGTTLWTQTWQKIWTHSVFFRDRSTGKLILVSYAESNGLTDVDELTNTGYTRLQRYTNLLEPGYKSLTYFESLDCKNDVVVFKKPGKTQYYDFISSDGSLKLYKNEEDNCGCPNPEPGNGTGIKGAIPALSNVLVNVRASSEFNANHGAHRAILNYKTDPNIPPSTDGSDGWSARFNDKNQYIVVGGITPMDFVGLQLQGRGDANQWVTSYKLRYTLDNLNWRDYENGKEFPGNSDRNTIVTLQFPTPVRARAFSLHPTAWNEHISLRMEWYVRPNSY
eukprot:gene855-1065_t